MKKSSKFIMAAFAGILSFTGLIGVFGAQEVYALTCPTGTPGAGRGVSSLAECSISEKGDTFIPTLLQIIKVILGVLGIVAVMVIILGGFMYITSNGDAAKLAKAKNTIIYSVIGLVVALLAFAIVNFVLDNVFHGEGENKEPDNQKNSQVQIDSMDVFC